MANDDTSSSKDSLPNCVCAIAQRMINERLTRYLKSSVINYRYCLSEAGVHISTHSQDGNIYPNAFYKNKEDKLCFDSEKDMIQHGSMTS